jgi:hypothetical protein
VTLTRRLRASLGGLMTPCSYMKSSPFLKLANSRTALRSAHWPSDVILSYLIALFWTYLFMRFV